MYSLVKTLGLRAAFTREIIPFAASFLVAEVLYKFHSFTLECLAFLLTWAALSCAQDLLLGRAGRSAHDGELLG
jgi:hypothetical protein